MHDGKLSRKRGEGGQEGSLEKEEEGGKRTLSQEVVL